MATRLELLALETVPQIAPGDDLAGVILDACRREGAGPQDGDVLVVAQKVVSKSEGRIVRLADVICSAEALQLAEKAAKDPRLVELILRESGEIVRCVPGVIIARHRLGVVLANAGIDQSNVGQQGGEESALLWPADPDASADRLRGEIAARHGAKVAVIVNDSLGRAWRKGTIGAAIGLSGLAGVVDMRGRTDLFGRELRSTEVGHADEVASAASIMMGQADEGRPVVIVRGLTCERREASARELIRERKLDLFP
jgi:coenzyme F420-0:L-glutamate ligase / coenzyme F420-1:gamma-L-glutamate ligase